MAKAFSLSGIRELDARIENQLREFAADEEEDSGKPKKWTKGQWAAGAAGSAAATAAIARPDLVKKGVKKPVDAVLRAGENTLAKGSLAAGSVRGKVAEKASGALFRGGSKVAGLRKKLRGLEAILDVQLQHFDEGGGRLSEEDYVGARTERKKKRRVVAGAAMAGTAAAGGLAIAGKRGEIKEAAKTAGFRGMRQTASGINKAGNAVNRVAGKLPGKAGETAVAAGKTLKKGAKRLRKASMKLFGARLDTVARGLVEFGVR